MLRLEEMETKVDIISMELITPSSPTPLDKKELRWSFIDQCQGYRFIPLLFFYQKQPVDSETNFDVPSSKTILHLKQSLSETLSRFYPLAGKLNPDLLSVDCDDSGVLFVEAKVDASLSEAVRNAPPKNVEQYLPFEPYIFCRTDHVKLCDLYSKNEILFAVQITCFGCGGSAIGVCMSHKVSDFSSALSFMNSWAALTRSENSSANKVVIKPNFDIGRQLLPPVDHTVDFTSTETAKKGKLVWKRFVFDKEKLIALKEQATLSSSSSSSSRLLNPTRVELVSGFLWKHFINVELAKNPQATTEFRIWHTFNMRSRLTRLASSCEYDEFPFGNLSLCAPASFISDENYKEDRDYYGDLVELTGEALRQLNEDYVLNRAVPFLKMLLITKGKGRLHPPPSSSMMVTDKCFASWCRFPTYEVDFGWGKPVSFGPATLTDGVVFLTNTRNDEGIEAWVTFSEEELSLLSDELLSLAASEYFNVIDE